MERKNRTLIEAARAMLDEYKTPTNYWAEAVSTACHAINRLYIHKKRDKTTYEFLTGKKPKVHYFRVLNPNVPYLTRNPKVQSLHQRLMMVSCLVMVLMNMDIVFSIKTTGLIEIAVDVTFDEIDGSQKEQVNVEIVGNEDAPHKAIKKLAIGEVKPIKDEDDDNIMHVDLDPATHHVSSNEYGEASTTRNDQDGRSSGAQGHSHEDGANNE